LADIRSSHEEYECGFKESLASTHQRWARSAGRLQDFPDRESGALKPGGHLRPPRSENSDVIQRTEGGFSRVVARITPGAAAHTRRVDVSCGEDACKRVKQVDVGQPP
jgi:hypothetical protein